MKTIKFLKLPLLLVLYFILSISFQSCKPDDDDDDCDKENMVYKPNIYIYPNEEIELSLKIHFPMGGVIVTSIPEYGKGWEIKVDSNGLINNTYSYLFYESKQPDVWQRQYGWVIKTDKLESFFRKNMNDYGFKNNEVDDFIEYWIPRLKDSPYYTIYPQTKNLINSVITLDFSEQPDNLLRLFYVIKGNNQIQNELIEPTIDNFERKGYFVTEWGVIL